MRVPPLSRIATIVPTTLRKAGPLAAFRVNAPRNPWQATHSQRKHKITPLEIPCRHHRTWTGSNPPPPSTSSWPWLWIAGAIGVVGVGMKAKIAFAEDDRNISAVDRLLDETNQALDKEDYIQAHKKLSQTYGYIRNHPQCEGRVKLAYAELYCALGEWDSAGDSAVKGFKLLYGAEAFRRLDGDPKLRSHVALILAEARYHSGDLEGARSELEQYVLKPEENPADGAGYLLLRGRIEFQRKQHDEARQHFAEAEKFVMKKRQRHQLDLALAELYKSEKRLPQALEHYQLAIMRASTDRQTWHARMEMGAIYEQQDELVLAIEQYKIARDLDSISPEDQQQGHAWGIAISPNQRQTSSKKIVQLHIQLGQLTEAGAAVRATPQTEKAAATIPVDAPNGLINVRKYTTPHSDYALMSLQVYQTDFIEPNDGWRPGWDSAQKKIGRFGYHGRAYVNHHSKEIVIAHRGTSELENWRTNLKLLDGTPDQILVAAHEFCEFVENATKDDYIGFRISHTGHSLGGVIAEVMACKFERDAVTFESPGSKPILKNLRKMNYVSIDPSDVKIIGYFAEPNLLSTAMEHVGLPLRIYTGVPDPELSWYQKLPIISWYTSFKNQAVDVTKSRHSMEAIATLFTESERDGALPITDRILVWPDQTTVGSFDTYERTMKDFLGGPQSRQRILRKEFSIPFPYNIEEYDNRRIDLTKDLSKPAADFIRTYLATDPTKRTNPYGVAEEVLGCIISHKGDVIRVGRGFIAPEFIAYLNKKIPEPKGAKSKL